MQTKVTVNREALVKALDPLLAFLKQKSLVDDQVGMVSFEKGRLYCKTEDAKMTAVCPFEMEDFVPFATSGEDLFRYLQRTKTDEVVLEVEKESLLKVTAKRAKASFHCRESFSFEYPTKWKKIGPGAVSVLVEASKYAAKTFYKPALTGVHINGKEVEGCNSYQMLRITTDIPIFTERILFPASLVPIFSSLEPYKYVLEDNMLFLKNKKGVVCVCVVLGGKFPSMEGLQNDLGSAASVSFSSTIADAVERCSVFTERLKFEEEKMLSIQFKGGKAYLKVQSFIGASNEVVSSKYPKEVEGRSFSIRPGLFAQCLQQSQKVLVGKKAIHIKTEDSWFVSAMIG